MKKKVVKKEEPKKVSAEEAIENPRIPNEVILGLLHSREVENV